MHIHDARLSNSGLLAALGPGMTRPHPSILEKSATARVAARISLSSFSRFSRNGLSSTLTVTLSKKASTWGRKLRHGAHGGFEIFLLDRARRLGLGGIDRLRQRLFLGQLVKAWIGRAGIFATVLLLLDADDVGRTFVAGEQVLAVLGIEEFSQSLDAADNQEEDRPGLRARTPRPPRSCRAPCSRSCALRRSAKKDEQTRWRSASRSLLTSLNVLSRSPSSSTLPTESLNADL